MQGKFVVCISMEVVKMMQHMLKGLILRFESNVIKWMLVLYVCVFGLHQSCTGFWSPPHLVITLRESHTLTQSKQAFNPYFIYSRKTDTRMQNHKIMQKHTLFV